MVAFVDSMAALTGFTGVSFAVDVLDGSDGGFSLCRGL